MGKSQYYYLLETGLDKVLREHIPVGDMKSSIIFRQKCFVLDCLSHPGHGRK